MSVKRMFVANIEQVDEEPLTMPSLEDLDLPDPRPGSEDEPEPVENTTGETPLPLPRMTFKKE
jgi:hypothetical protein